MKESMEELNKMILTKKKYSKLHIDMQKKWKEIIRLVLHMP